MSERDPGSLSAEIVGVGTELLLGQIANTNAQHISRALATVGVDVYFHSAVGDNLERVASTLAAASARADVVIVTGGLGPTPDDLTRDAVAKFAGLALLRDERLARRIADFFAARGRAMPEANLKQADLPEGSIPIDPVGTAPGFILPLASGGLVALPGVPWEMRSMLDSDVLAWLRARVGDRVIVSRQVLVIGLGESTTHALIADIVEAQSNPTIAFLAGSGQVRVRITAKAGGTAAAEALIAPVELAVRERLGAAAVPGPRESLTEVLGDMLLARGATVAAAESLTGGLIGARLTEVEGSSQFFVGSLVCYATEAKQTLGGVSRAIVEGPGVVSEEAARALAEAAAERLGADLGIAATGVAGPEPQEDKPPGTVWVGATYRGRTEARLLQAYGDRSNVRAQSVTAAIDLGRRLLEGAV